MFVCDCGCETVCVTRVVLRCGDDGRAEHRIEVADGSRRGLAWRVARIVVVGEFHLGGPEVLRTEVACARCGGPVSDGITERLVERAADVDQEPEGVVVILPGLPTPPRSRDRAVA